ncbi:MAG TPA: VWA domain-containing protein [Rhodanobacteraceae bacterium]|nr:VWA domain-containing protein [Rhodanobacteraceae bacterium]
MNFADLPLHFLRPWWWLAALPLPLVLWMLARGGGGRAAFGKLVDATLLPHIVRDTGKRRWAGAALLASAWLLGTAALAGPAWQRMETPLYVNGAARVVALSLSNDMLAQDLAPDRMTRARFAVHDLIDAAGDARTALVAYAGAAFTVAPLTSDKHTVLNLLRALQPNVMPVPGNDAAAGIAHSVQLLQDARVRGGEIIVVTDRADTAALTAARKAHAAGIRIDVLGIGTTQGAPVPEAGGGFAGGSNGTLLAHRDDASLRALAAAGGGAYAILPTDGGATPEFASPVAMAGQASHDERGQVWRDGGVWLLPILVLLAALAFRRGWLLLLAVLVLPVTMPSASAATPSAWWNNRDQRALQALQDGDAQQARQLAASSGLRGSADYRAGDYADAAKAFAQGRDARAHYNLGNALAKQGEYQKAMNAYREALRQDPKFADARANLDAVEAWLKRRPPPQPSQDGGKSGKSARDGSAGKNQSGANSGTSKHGGEQPAPSSSAGDASGGHSDAQANSSAPGAPASAQAGASADAGKASAAEAARQREQAARAAQGLQQALQQGTRERSRSGSAAPHAFALGEHEPQADGKFDAQQRALLHSVPDDPGALLRRKFQLEWERRTGQQQSGGS